MILFTFLPSNNVLFIERCEFIHFCLSHSTNISNCFVLSTENSTKRMQFLNDRLTIEWKHLGINHCGRLWPAESACCDWDENKCTDYSRPVETKGRYGTLLKWESCGHFFKGRAHRPLPGQAFIVFPGSYIKEGFIIYYIEYGCLHFRYHQRNEHNKCRRERWWAD